jgi:hypothetical protein
MVFLRTQTRHADIHQRAFRNLMSGTPLHAPYRVGGVKLRRDGIWDFCGRGAPILLDKSARYLPCDAHRLHAAPIRPSLKTTPKPAQLSCSNVMNRVNNPSLSRRPAGRVNIPPNSQVGMHDVRLKRPKQTVQAHPECWIEPTPLVEIVCRNPVMFQIGFYGRVQRAI